MAKKPVDSPGEGLAPLFSLEEFRATKANADLLAAQKRERAQQRQQRQKLKKDQQLQEREKKTKVEPSNDTSLANPLVEMLAAYLNDPLAFSGESQYQPVNNNASNEEDEKATTGKGGGRTSSPRQESVLPPIDSEEPSHLAITGLALRKMITKLDDCFRQYQKPLDYLGERLQVPENIGTQMAELFRRLNCELLVLSTRADDDSKWVAQVLAEVSLRVNNGLLGLFFAHIWQDLASRIESQSITPVVLLHWLRDLETSYEKVFLAQFNRLSEILLPDLLNDLQIELQNQGQALSIEDLLLRSWVSAQVSYTDGIDENGGKADPYATVFLLFLAVAAQLYMELTEGADSILEPTINMIAEISHWEEAAKLGAYKYFEICWNGELTDSQYQMYRANLDKKACYGAAAGLADEFGIGERGFALITSRPQGNLKLLPMEYGHARIQKIHPTSRPFETSPHIENLVLGHMWGNVAPQKPAVWAFTSAIGMVAELAEAGVRVFYNPELKAINLEPLLADFTQPILQLVPGSVEQANLLKQEVNRLSRRKQQYPQIQINPSVNELQLLQLALELVLPVDTQISQKELELLQQSRCYQALSSQRNWEISREEQLETIAAALEDSEEYLRVLVPAKVDSNLLYRLQIVISEKSPGSRVDYINTLVGEHLLLGVLD